MGPTTIEDRFVKSADDRLSWLTLFVLTLVAGTSRVWGFWGWEVVDDEFFTISEAYARYTGLKNPLYYALVVGGYEVFGQSAWVARLPAVVFGALSIPVCYAIWVPVFGRRVAAVASIVLIFSAWHLWFSQLARFYSGVFLLGALAYWAFFQATRRRGVGWLVAGVLLSATAALFHASAALLPVSAGFGYLCLWLASSKAWRSEHPNIGRFIALGLVMAVLAIPLAFKVASWWAGTGQTWGYGGIMIVAQYVRYVQLPIGVGAFIGIVFLWYQDRPYFWFMFGALLVPVAFLAIASLFMSISPYYAYFAFPLVVLLCGYGLVSLARHPIPARDGLALVFLVLLTVVPMAPEFGSHYTGRGTLDFSEAEQFVADHYRSGDRVLSFIPEFDLPDGRAANIVPFISFERDERIAWAEELARLSAQSDRLWVLTSAKRSPLAAELEAWLLCHGQLVWRDYATRFDAEVDGYEVYQVNADASSGLSSCRFD